MGDVRTPTNYQEGGAGDLVAYIGRDSPLFDSTGEEMEADEVQEFIDRSEEYEFGRQITVSPEDGNDLTDDELSLIGRQTMNEFVEERPTATYCYAIHDDTDHTHVQVALTGERTDLYMDQDDCRELRETAERHHEQHQRMTNDFQQAYQNEIAEEMDLSAEQDNSQSRTFAVTGLSIVLAGTISVGGLPSLYSGLFPLQGRTPYGFWTDLGITIVAVVIPGLIALYLLYRMYRGSRDYLTKRRMRGVARNGDYPIPFDVENEQPARWWLKPRIIEAISVSGEGGMFALGESGSGKTETIKLLVHPWISTPTDSYVIFDYKGDWEQHFGHYVIKLSISDSTHYWNVFREIEREEDFDEIAGVLFQAGDDGDGFFPKAARQLFGAVLKYLYREFDEDDEFPTNADLVAFCESTTPTELHDALTEHSDLVAAASALDPEAEGQASGVFATFQQQIQDVFSGDFAKSGHFSVREYIQGPQGYKLLLRYNPRRGQSTKPAFSFFMEWAIRYSLDSELTGQSYFLLDEFARVPAVGNMEELANVGRGMGVRTILGIQSYKQVTDTYGRDRGDALLDGLTRGVIKRVNANTVEYAQQLISQQWETKEVPQYDNEGNKVASNTTQELRQAFSDDQLTSLSVDEAVVIQNSGWVYGQLPLLENEREMMDYAAERTPGNEFDVKESHEDRKSGEGTKTAGQKEVAADD